MVSCSQCRKQSPTFVGVGHPVPIRTQSREGVWIFRHVPVNGVRQCKHRELVVRRQRVLTPAGAASIYAARMSRGFVYIYGGRRDSARRADTELVPLSEAVPHVYTQVTGTSLSLIVNALSDALLSEVAQAIADLVTIHGAPNTQEPLRPLPWAEVKLGVFQRAASVMRTSGGIEYRRLYIRRGDVRGAITVLKRSRALFADIEEIRAASEASIAPVVGVKMTRNCLRDSLN
jgi:hypothetical protein